LSNLVFNFRSAGEVEGGKEKKGSSPPGHLTRPLRYWPPRSEGRKKRKRRKGGFSSFSFHYSSNDSGREKGKKRGEGKRGGEWSPLF